MQWELHSPLTCRYIRPSLHCVQAAGILFLRWAETMSFALYRRPGGVVFLDDDPDYLEMLAAVMPQEWHVRLFMRPIACIELLQSEASPWEADAWRQQDIIRRWREGASLVPQILQYWREDGTTRFGFTQICVVDYSMPAMTGLEVLSGVSGWSGSRALLTGRADELLAVSAFNRGLIEQFIPKQAPEVRRRITESVQGLLETPNPRHEQIWRSTLSREQHALLREPRVTRALEDIARRQGWIEHVVIGSPFGVLSLDDNANIGWLQLELQDNLGELAEMAQSQGFDSDTVQLVKHGKKLIDVELAPALGAAHKAMPQEAFEVGAGSGLHAALFRLDPAFSPGLAASYSQFMAARADRTLSD